MIERGKHKAVNVTERQSLRGFAPQHVEVMCRRTRISASNAVRGRNTPIKAHRSTCKDRSSAASISRFAVAVIRFEFAVETGCWV
jgi:hypothetical protein